MTRTTAADWAEIKATLPARPPFARWWTLKFDQPAEQMNLNDRDHWGRHHTTVKAWRQRVWAAVTEQSRSISPIPKHHVDGACRRALVHVDLPVRSLKQRRDPSNWAPTVKAIVDGLVDAQVWPDDNSDWVVTDEPSFHQGGHEVVITITELVDEPASTPEPTMPKPTAIIEPPSITEFDTTPIFEIPIGLVHPAPDNPRIDLGDLTGMIESIATVGILEPCIVVADHQHGGYMLVAGHRRHAAAQAACLATVPCILKTYTTPARIEATAIENLNRKDLTPLEEARWVQALTDLGRSQREIATATGMTQGMVSKRLALTRLPATATDLLTAGKLTVRQAEQMADLDDADIDTVANLVADASTRYQAGDEMPSWVVGNAVESLRKTRRHTEAEQIGTASGLKRITSKPYVGAGDHSPCGRGKATHWYLGTNDVTVTWAHTSKAAQKERDKKNAATTASTATSATTGPTDAELRSTARDRIAAFINAIARQAHTNPKILRAVIVAVALGYHELILAPGPSWTKRLTFDPLGFDDPTDDIDTWLQTDAEANLAIALLFRLAEPDWTNTPSIYQLFIALGYRPGPGETPPATDPAGITPDIEFANTTLNDPHFDPLTTQQPQLHQADPVPESARCHTCTRPATAINPDTGEPICDACWETTIDTAAATQLHTPTKEEERAAEDARQRDREQLRITERIAALPDDMQQWIIDYPDDITRLPWSDYHKRNADVLTKIAGLELPHVYLLRNIVAYEIHQSDLTRRPPVITAALTRLTELAAKHTPPPKRPWGTYDGPIPRLLKTIRGLDHLEVLDAAHAYEIHHYDGGRPDVIAAYTERRTQLETAS